MKLKSSFKSSLGSSTLIAAFVFLTYSVAVNAQSSGQARQLQQPAAVTSLPGKAKRWALVIGVDKYRDAQISPLKGSDNDARTLADALVRFAGFPPDQVILMATDQPNERQPTRVNILRRLSNLSAVVPKDGLLLISFAGHGMERNGQAYLLPSDAQISDDITFLEETALSLARMKERIRATGVGQVLVLLDACRNDPGGRADAPNQMSQAYVRGFNFDVRNREVQAFATVYATAVGQRAYEYSERQQGYFTWAVVEGLKGAAANANGEVTLAGLVDYIQNTVPKRIGIDLGGNKQQRPFAIVEGYKADQLVIAVGGAPNTLPASAPPAAAPDSAAVEMSFWDTIKNSNEPSDFQAYLDRFPSGTFSALARTRANRNAPSTPPVVESGPPRTEANVNVEETMEQAQRDLKDGDYAKAISISRKILAANPEQPKANLLLGLSYLKSGKYTNSANYLSKALALGEQVDIPIQHHHNVFMIGDALCSGVLRLTNGLFEFHSSSVPKDDFSVPLSKVYEMVVDQSGGGRIRVKVGIDKGGKEDKRNLSFHLPTAYVGKKAGSSLTWVFCEDCFTGVQSMSQLLQQLIREAAQKQEISAAVVPAATQGTTPPSMGGDNDRLLQELLNLEQQGLDAFNRGDKAVFVAMMAENCVVISNGKAYTKEQYLSQVKPQSILLSLSYETVKASVEGDTAKLEGVAVYRAQNSTAMATVRQKFVDSFVKRDGKWLVVKSEVTSLK